MVNIFIIINDIATWIVVLGTVGDRCNLLMNDDVSQWRNHD